MRPPSLIWRRCGRQTADATSHRSLILPTITALSTKVALTAYCSRDDSQGSREFTLAQLVRFARNRAGRSRAAAPLGDRDG
jgi:hypothetical protein